MLQTDISATHDERMRPGWGEIVVGILVFAVVGYGGGLMIVRLEIEPVVTGLIIAALSGIAGLAGFAAAVAMRIRSWSAFGLRPVSRRWLLIGLAAGLAAFVIKGFAIMAYVAVTGQDSNPQDIFALGGSGGPLTLVLATIFVGILTPIGEEFLFRGVVTNALLRYGAVVGVVGSTVIFALMHGINMVLPAALVAGLAAGELFRRSGSVWPPVVLHIVFNLPTVPVLVLVAATQ